MIGGGAQKGKAQRYIHRMPKIQCLDGAQNLIVIHAHNNIITAKIHKYGIGGQGALDHHGGQGILQRFQGWGDKGLFFLAQMPPLPRMGGRGSDKPIMTMQRW